jgi:uncharacterized protein YoxC
MSDPALTQMVGKASNTLDAVNGVANLAKSKLEAETLTTKMETTLSELNTLLQKANTLTEGTGAPAQKEAIQQVVKDATVTLKNLRQFSEKLQGHFVLWKLAF